MEHNSLENRPVGRPRSASAHAAILDASIALVREVGYDAVTMDGVAARAGVGKATVYRRWKTKETLVAEALQRFMRAIPVPDTGSTAGDLLALARGTVRMYRDPATAALLSGLLAATARSEQIAEAVRGGFVAARADATREVLARGVARGDVAPDFDVELALDLLRGPLLFRALLGGGRVDERFARDVVRTVLCGLAPTAAARRRRGRTATVRRSRPW